MKSIVKHLMGLLALSLLITAAGCTIYSKPRIDNYNYKNFEFEFKFKIPNGWVCHSNIPDELAKSVAAEYADNFVFMLTNPQTEGIILLTAEKSDFDIISIGYNKDILKEKLEAKIAEWKARLDKRYGFQDYTSQLYPVEISEGYGPTLVYSETATSEAGDNYARGYLLNKCRKDQTCTVQVTLISKTPQYEKNYEVFSNVVNSLTKVYN